MKNERGYALLITVFTIVIIAVIGVSLITITANSNRTTVSERQSQSLYYIAEAGINNEKAEVIKIISDFTNKAILYMNTLPTSEQKAEKFEEKILSELKAEFCNHGTDTVCDKRNILNDYFNLQNNKQPLAHVKNSMQCKSENGKTTCEFSLTSKGYIKNEESRNRQLTQQLKISLDELAQANISTENGESPTQDLGNYPAELLNALSGFAALVSNTIQIDKSGILEGFMGSQLGKNGFINIPQNDKRIKDVSALNGVDLNILLPPTPAFVISSSVPTYNLNNLGSPRSMPVQCIIDADKPTKRKEYVFQCDAGIKKYDLLDLSQGNYYKLGDLIVDRNDLEIRTGNQDVYLVVDKFLMNAQNLKVTGNGKLHLIVKEEIQLDDKVNEDGSINKLAIYYEGNKKWEIKKEKFILNGDLIVRNAEFYTEKEIEVNGTFYADKSNISFADGVKINNFHLNSGNVNITSSAKFYGHYIQLNGNLNIENYTHFYDETYLGNVDLVSGGGSDFYKNLYIKNGNATFNRLVNIHGSIYFEGKKQISINHTVDAKKGKPIIAPNGKVVLTGTADVKSPVIAKDILIQNGYIKYDGTVNLGNMPSPPPPTQNSKVIFTPLKYSIYESPLIEK